MNMMPHPTGTSPVNETVGLGAYLIQQGITLPEIAERGNEFMICYRVAHKQEHGTDPGDTLHNRQLAAQIVEQMWPDRTCNEYCAGEHDGCDPAEGIHVSAPFVTTSGGPMAEAHALPGTIDTTTTVGMDRLDDGTLITLNLRIFTFDGGTWSAPPEINALLPGITMNSARARHLSRLLDGAADEYDRIARGRK